ncbi:MAG: hypothetical protein M3O35_15095 [Acidobacteriota bacterium]|nr:hypothetical protein [Acidobacteriota bacterium]
MEPVTVTVYCEADSRPKKYGACYERANGEKTIIATGEIASGIEKDKADAAVKECEWEPFKVRMHGVANVGYGWIDEPEPSD